MKKKESPTLTQDEKLIARPEFQSMLVESKVMLGVEFDNITTFSTVEVKIWLSNFVVYNMEGSSLCKDKVDILQSINDEFLTVKVRYKITMALLQDYVKSWV